MTIPRKPPVKATGVLLRPVLIACAVAALATGCWYHRVDVPSPVTAAAVHTDTRWSFLWRSKRIEPPAECVTRSLQQVVVRSHWAFSLISVATLGLVSPARVEMHCARPIIHDAATPPDTAATGPPAGATYWSTVWGSYQREPGPDCNDRPLQEVIVRPNPVFDLVAVVSLGLAAPVRIRWTCVPGPSDGGGSLESLP